MNGLRERLISVAMTWKEPEVSDELAETIAVNRISEVLAEIEAAGWGPLSECECEDCYPELTAAAGRPLPDGVTSITWGWGEMPEYRLRPDEIEFVDGGE